MSNYNIFEEFKSLTTKDIQQFFSDCLDFFRNDYNTILQYYQGTLKEIESTSFERFEVLDRQKQEMFTVFQMHSRQMTTTLWWDLLEQLEQIDDRFNMLRKAYKWTRSSATNFSYSPNIQIDYVLTQNDTLEKVSKTVLNNDNPQDDWVSIALDNQLREEDYDIEGGKQVKLDLRNSINLGLSILSVVDTINGKSIYGKDIQDIIEFSAIDSEGDLIVLDYDATIQQSVKILTDLRKGHNPDLPNSGLQKSVVVGTNKALLNFPVITRQFSEVFATDDSLKNFSVKQLSLEQDNLLLSFEISTRLNEVEKKQSIL